MTPKPFLLRIFTLLSVLPFTLTSQWVHTSTLYAGSDVQVLAASGGTVFAGTSGNGVYRTTDNGTAWSAANTGLASLAVNALIVSGANLFAGTSDGVFLSTNNGSQWSSVSTGISSTYIRSLLSTGADLYAGTWGGGIFRSTNNGAQWTAVNTGLTNNDVLSLGVTGGTLFAGTNGGGVFRSTDNGGTWSAINSGLTDNGIYSLVVNGTNIFAGTPVGVFRSTNSGDAWTSVNSGLTNTVVYSITMSGANLIAGTNGGGVFVSTNSGTSWVEINNGLVNKNVHSLLVSGSDLFAGTNGSGVYFWANAPLPVELLSFSAVPRLSSVYIRWETATETNSAGWNIERREIGDDASLPSNGSTKESTSAVWRSLGFIQGAGNSNAPLTYGFTDVMVPEGHYRYRLRQIDRDGTNTISGMTDVEVISPQQFRLDQNTPNPFNPSTTITYSIPKSGYTSLRVFNNVGQEIATLVNTLQTPGRYSVSWDAASLSSGMYFYQLSSGGVSQTKRMIVIK